MSAASASQLVRPSADTFDVASVDSAHSKADAGMGLLGRDGTDLVSDGASYLALKTMAAAYGVALMFHTVKRCSGNHQMELRGVVVSEAAADFDDWLCILATTAYIAPLAI